MQLSNFYLRAEKASSCGINGFLPRIFFPELPLKLAKLDNKIQEFYKPACAIQVNRPY